MMQVGKLSLGLCLCALLTGCALGLLHTVEQGEVGAVAARLDAGADVNAKLPILGTHPLIAAAARGHLDTVRLLLERGADVNAADLTGWTPLHAAAYSGNPEIIKLLLERGAVPVEETWYLPSPLTVAEQLDWADAVELLKYAKAHPNAYFVAHDRSSKETQEAKPGPPVSTRN